MQELGDSNLTQDGSIAGSPLYMSPEQATGDSTPDARSDIYSLGAVAYFLLTGRPPFVEEKAIKVLMAHAYEKPNPPSRFEPGIPLDLERIVLKCLEKKPADRYQSTDELAADLAGVSASGRWTSQDARSWWERNEAGGLATSRSLDETPVVHDPTDLEDESQIYSSTQLSTIG
jgi:serine/threonine-protein kinase